MLKKTTLAAAVYSFKIFTILYDKENELKQFGVSAGSEKNLKFNNLSTFFFLWRNASEG